LIQYPCGKDGASYAIPNTIERLETYSFLGCSGLSTVTIPPSVTQIRGNAFEGSGLKSVTIPSTVTYLANSVFRDCINLESVTMEGLSFVPSGSFEGCINLKYVSLPQSIKQLSGRAFKGCRSLSNLTIPSEVDTMDTDTFEGCTSLTYIKFEGKFDPYYSEHCSYFDTCNSLDIICVPLDYVNSTFFGRSICKTSHCEEEVSKYNHCYELIKCGEPDAQVRLRANASEWIHQTDGCVEYVCDNISGRVSWSKCNNSKCVEGTCANNQNITQTEELEVEFTVDLSVDNWNVTDATATIQSLGTPETKAGNETRIGVNISDEGFVVRIFLLMNVEEAADVITTVGNQCSRDPNNPVVYDDMCDEFNCTGFMQNVKGVRVLHLQKIEEKEELEELFLEESYYNHANQLMLLLSISLMAIAAYLI